MYSFELMILFMPPSNPIGSKPKKCVSAIVVLFVMLLYIQSNTSYANITRELAYMIHPYTSSAMKYDDKQLR